ncbi:MAG TPA: metalloregulator ArsR/SmtB family transcription factor [Melioribacteraceae bacterium]|nr:metalloregulator ArsR/SmtB family transcription factor [Melioribacteraceae bacterium]
MEEKVKIFKALSDANRLRILKILQEKSLCVCEIKEVLQLANSTVSQHLSLLKETGFIIEAKEGKWVNYMINPKPDNPIVSSILAMLVFWLQDEITIQNDLKIICDVDRNVICNK